MEKIKNWLSALRPRTLFLAVATTLCGSGIALSTKHFDITIFILTTLTATVLQLVSNLANDLGDFQHGTDITGERVGPQRTVQSGVISPVQMKKAIITGIGFAIITGLWLIYEASRFLNWEIIALFILLGCLSILAAVKYTAGNNPYGYKGLGDLFAFLFFGPVSVIGTYFLHRHQLDFRPVLPAIGMGLFTVAVLNINNMRDMENDMKAGKITVAVRLGLKNAKRYHAVLTFGAIGSFLLFNIIYAEYWWQYVYFIVSIRFIKILKGIYKTTENQKLDPYLKYTSLAAFSWAVLFFIWYNPVVIMFFIMLMYLILE